MLMKNKTENSTNNNNIKNSIALATMTPLSNTNRLMTSTPHAGSESLKIPMSATPIAKASARSKKSKKNLSGMTIAEIMNDENL